MTAAEIERCSQPQQQSGRGQLQCPAATRGSRWWTWKAGLGTAALLMLVSGTFDTTATKGMNRHHLPSCEGCENRYFEAPLLQTLTGYVGQSLFLLFFLGDLLISRCRRKTAVCARAIPSSERHKSRAPAFIWFIPLLFDYGTTCALNVSTMLAQASTVQMLRSSSILLSFLLSAFVLKNKIYVHQTIGVLLIFLGLVLVAIYAILNPDVHNNYSGGSSASAQKWGIAAALVGTALGACQWVLEEYLFRYYSCSSVEAVGWMGLFGVCLGSFTLLIAEMVGLEDVKGALYQMTRPNNSASRTLLQLNCAYIISLSINTASGLVVTQLASSLLRTMINAGRTASVWLIELKLGWAAFSQLNFCGLCLISAAILMYNYNYFTSRTNHWPGDKLLRSPAACLPNRIERSSVGQESQGTAAATEDNRLSPVPDEEQLLMELRLRSRTATQG